MKHRIIGNWSVREFLTEGDRKGYHVYPAGERSHWAIKATLWPASDGKCFVISMNRRAMDARPSLDAALEHVLGILGGALAKTPDASLSPSVRGEAFIEHSAT
jgi:hypothetical protein